MFYGNDFTENISIGEVGLIYSRQKNFLPSQPLPKKKKKIPATPKEHPPNLLSE